MSLINDALKKAQKQRSQDPATVFVPSFAKGAAPERGSAAKKSRAIRPLVTLGLCAVALSAVSIGTTLFILHSDSPPAPSPIKKPAAPSVVASSPSSAPLAPTAATAPAPTSLAAPAVTPSQAATALVTSGFVAPTPPPAVAVAGMPKAEVSVATTPAPAPAVALPLNPAAKPPEAEVALHPRGSETPKATMRIQGVIDKLRVAGIRVSSTESKVILNERLYRLNDVVDPVLGLRLTTVELHALTFTDEAGATYVKIF